jgi:hypothetical protein
MDKYIYSFARMEKKYILDKKKMADFLTAAGLRIVEDSYPHSIINSIYFDSIDNRLIRTSLDKPLYKEKIRLRTYSDSVNKDTAAFAEIKRKVKGKVYKRRIDGTFGDLYQWLNTIGAAGDGSQISDEIAYLRDFYRASIPSMQIAYRRDSFIDSTDPTLRITFDTDVIWRDWGLEQNADVYGFRLLDEDVVLMEIKVSGNAIPIWILRLIDQYEISSSSISKYGQAYLFRNNQELYGMKTTTLKEERIKQYA